MRPEENVEKIIKKFDIDVNPKKDHEIFDELRQIQAKSKQSKPDISTIGIRRIIMKNRIAKFAAAALIILTVLGGINFWPSSSESENWWLGPSAAWGQEIIVSLESLEAITYRQRVFKVRDYEPDIMDTLWERRYYAKDAYRRDLYDENNDIFNTQWILSDEEENIQYEVSFKYECYFEEKKKYISYYEDLLNHLRRYVSFLDRASKILGTETFEDRECVGFEVSPGLYGNFTVTRPTHIWFDVETKLPVRIERYGIKDGFDATKTMTIIHDQFDYYAEVPADMFTLQIPEGFVNAKQGEIIAARKGEMIFADVPEELRNEIVSALKEVQTVIYQAPFEVTMGDGETQAYSPRNMYIAQDSWRIDSHKWTTPQKTKWYAIQKEGSKEIKSDFGGHNFKLIETIVNFTDETYSVATYEDTSQHRHPMDRILFLAGLVNRADRILENTEIEGIECFGFEISASKRGNNNPNNKHRLWFDIETKLPVRMEYEYWQPNSKKTVQIREHFQWDPDLPKETFKPIIPEGFELTDKNI
jgi:outer membrane lipoprotein-sorting protein